ncbi:butyrophilin-like protein 2 [Silurus meridionalis]|uniref:butyrophilin-like protein 2 n=1 Tax=Silurus meridionalis TaxID=175797 RepID=UPI001EEB8F92|nr:butyrophilin-like protein 2 [Silurus meridionalis]
MSASPKTSRVEFSTQRSSVGDTVTLQYNPQKISKGTREIRWYKGTECIHQETIGDNLFLTLKDVKDTDSGQYRCEAHGKSKKEVAVIYLHVAEFKVVSGVYSFSPSNYFPGDDVTLPCHLSPKKSAVAMEIRWFKGTDCICVYQNGQVNEGKGYEGRVSLFTNQLEEGNVSLMLGNVQKSDKGKYKCVVTHGKDKMENDRNWLRLKELKLVSEPYSYLIYSRTFYTCAGDQVTLPCYLSAKISAVAMEIRWFKGTDCICVYQNGQVNEGKGYEGRVSLFTQKLENRNLSLMLKNVQESDDGEYKCEVTRGKHKMENSGVYLHVSEFKLVCRSEDVGQSTESEYGFHEMLVADGADATLPCYLSPKKSAVAMVIRWFKETDCICVYQNGQVKEENDYKGRVRFFTHELEEGNVSLLLKNVQESDNGMYKCEVTQGKVKVENNRNWLRVSELKLVSAPFLHIVHRKKLSLSEPYHFYTCAGDTVTLLCLLSPITSAVAMEIRWFKGTDCICQYQNEQIKEGKGYEGRVSLLPQQLGEGNVSLMLMNVQKSDAGEYTCEVTG